MERLYSILEIMKIKDIVRFHSETTMPIPDVVYHLYSLPSFDNNQTREELLGQDIQSNKFTVPNRCILFNKLNVRFKRIWRIDSDEDHKIASTEFLPLIIDENKVDFAYCFYLLASPAITDYLCGQNANTSGSHKRIDPTNFFNIGIKLPPLAQQYEIGKLLSSLDAKIKLNRQINQNLEAMAKQLYDYWFVQFDFPNEEGKPYKSSGGEMVWNEKLKREIPKEWEIRPLNSLITVKDGTHESPKQQLEGRYLITSKHLLSSGIDYNTAYYISEEDYIAINKRSQVETNDILFSMIGTIGNKYLVAEKNVNFAIKNMALLKTSKSMHIMYFLWLYLSSWDYKHYEFNVISGSIQKFLSLDAMRNIPVPFNYDIAVAFNKQVSNICQCIINLKEENIQLIKQRNELLPLLMNGQVSVNLIYRYIRKGEEKSLLNSKRCVRHSSPSSAIHNCFGQRFLDR